MAGDLAQLLLSAGLVDQGAVAEARAELGGRGGTLAEYLVLQGALDDEVLTEFLRSRLLVKRMDPNALVGIPHNISRAIPRDMACALRLMPVAIGDDGNITVVFSDPTDETASNEVAYHTGLYVVRAIATQLQVAWCLGHYYDYISTLGETLIVPSEPAAAKPRRRGLTDEVNAMRKPVLVPTGDEGETVDPEWIARRAEELKRQLHDEEPRGNTDQLPAVGEVQARRESRMIPRNALAEAGLPAVVVDSGVDSQSGSNSREATTKKQKFIEAPPGTDDDFDRSTRRLEPIARDPEDSRKTGRRPALSAEHLAQVAAEVSSELESAVPARDSAKTQRMPAPVFDETDSLIDDGRATLRIPMAAMGVDDGTITAPHEVGTESRPILLRHPPTHDEEVVLLSNRKQPAGKQTAGSRPQRSTKAGVGPARAQSSVSTQTRGATPAYTASDSATVPTDTLDDDDMTTRKLPKSTVKASDVDDGWGDDDLFGPPGTTIPPDFLGATSEAEADGENIPLQVSDLESAESPKGKNGARKRAKRATTPPTADDTLRLTETVKELGQTDDRNAVFDLLMDFMAGTHTRVAFFAVKKGKVCAWKHKDLDAADDSAEVALAESQTLGGIVESQAPYLGSDFDATTAEFLTRATGAPPEDIVAAPVAIGPRVIGVLFGDAPTGTLFEQQVSMVTRSAGLALQRILQAAKSK